MPRTLNIPKRSLQEIVDDQPGNTVVAEPAKEPKAATPESVQAAPLDDKVETGQSSDTAPLPEGELRRSIYEELAKPFGWAPKEEWKRDPAKWRDAEEFLKDTPKQLEAHKEQARRAAQAAEAAFEEDRRRLLSVAEAKVKAAAEAQDPDAAAAAAREVAAHSGPPPQTVAWMARNAWFNQDRGAQAVAVTAIRKAEAAGLNIEEQLEAGEMAAKKRFPEYFAEETPATVREAPKEEVRLSEIKRPPAVNAPSRTTASEKPNKERGYADLPQVARQAYERHFERKFMSQHGLSKEDGQARYAASYWKDNT